MNRRKNIFYAAQQPTEEQLVAERARLAFLRGMKEEADLDEIQSKLENEYPKYSYAIRRARMDADWIFKTN